MKLRIFSTVLLAAAMVFSFSKCSEQKSSSNETTTNTNQFGGYESQVKWGEHIVAISGCNDCHTPKKMGPMGPENDSSLLLSGHPAQMPAPDFDLKTAQAKGLAVTNTLTAWIGPWGSSYSANITPDSTGIGAWTEQQFMTCIRDGKFKGLEGGRPLLPPMPWQGFRQMTDDEIKAVFAYLKSIKPIHNVVPEAVIAPPPPQQ